MHTHRAVLMYNPYTLAICTVEWFLVYSELCNHHQFQTIFITLKRNLIPISSHMPIRPSSSEALATTSLLVFTDLPVPDISFQWNQFHFRNRMIPDLLLSSFFIMFLRFFYIVACSRYEISYYYWIIFHCVAIYHIIFVIIWWWTFDLSPPFG